jgi:tetratricopeptide (TPR) repeat protein
MNPKISSILEKVHQEQKHGKYPKALKRLNEAISKYPEEAILYVEAMEISLEAGESLQATQYFKQAEKKFPEERDRLWALGEAKIKTYNDSILGKFLLEQAVKKRDLETAWSILEKLQNHTAEELLKRTRTKRQSLTTAQGGGFTLKGEVLLNAISEALLCIRSKRHREAVKGFLRILDEKPIEYELIERFCRQLDKTHTNDGGFRYLLGCCHLAAEKFDDAFNKITQAVKISPNLSLDAIGRLAALRDHPRVRKDELDFALAHLYLITGDELHSLEILHSIMEQHVHFAPRVLDLLELYVGESWDSLNLHYLYIEVALHANRKATALNHINKISVDRRRKNDVLAWLDRKSQERFLPSDVTLLYAQIALREGMVEKAIEIFRDYLTTGSGEVTVVQSVLEKHKSNARVEEFYNKLASEETRSGQESGFEIEHFQNNDFSLGDSVAGKGEDGSPGEGHKKPSGDVPSWVIARGISSGAGHQERTPEPPPSDTDPLSDRTSGSSKTPPLNTSFEQSRERILGEAPQAGEDEGMPDMERAGEPGRGFKRAGGPSNDPFDRAHPIQDELPGRAEGGRRHDDANDTAAEPQDAPHDDSAGKADSAAGDEAPGSNSSDDAHEMQQPTTEQSEDHIEDAGAPDGCPPSPPGVIILGGGEDATSKQDGRDEVPVPPEASPPPTREDTSRADPLPIADEPSVKAEDFASRLERFERGGMENAEILRLVEEACHKGEFETMKTLLSFHPQTISEEVSRRFYLAEYYLNDSRALNALMILKTININGLAKEERKRILHKIANCYQELNMYEAAHSTFLRLLSEDPALGDVERLARWNYHRYMRQIAGKAPVLEKITSIKDD